MAQSSDRWNPLRLIDTLSFFGEVPFVGSFRWLQQMFGASANPQAPTQSELQPPSEVVLLTQEAAKADDIMAMLRSRGIAARTCLTPSDSPLSQTDPNRIVNAKALLWVGVADDAECLKARVEEITSLPASEDCGLFDFRSVDTERLKDVWGAVDDVVMGGASSSGMSLLPGYARFSGTVSTANSGGFASVRTLNFEPPFNLSDWQGVRLVVRGDGQRYKVILRNSDSWDSLAYCASVDTEPDQWIGVDVPFAALEATFRAKTQPSAPPLNPASVCSFQLMLSKFEYDGDKNPTFKPGPFSLDIKLIGVYRLAASPQLVAIAPSSSQADTYTQLLSQTGMAHQVLTMADGDDVSEQLAHTLERAYSEG